MRIRIDTSARVRQGVCCFQEDAIETAGRLRFADVFVPIEDPRQSAKDKHDQVEFGVAVNAVLVGAGMFAEIELWAEEKLK